MTDRELMIKLLEAAINTTLARDISTGRFVVANIHQLADILLDGVRARERRIFRSTPKPEHVE